MSIRKLTHSDRVAWDQYVQKAPLASCYHLTGWKDVIEQSFGHESYYLLSEDDQHRINGILPLVRLKSTLFGNYMVSLPFFNYGGVCADTAPLAERLIKEASYVARASGAEHIEFRQTQQLKNGMPVKTAKVSMRLALPSNPDVLFKSFSSKLRSQVQRPLRDGMYAVLGREELLDDFYAVFSENMRDLGTPVYSKAFFRNIVKQFPDFAVICVIYTKEQVPAAAGLLIGFRNTMEIPWASSLRRFNRLSPNMLLYWTVLKFSCEQGYEQFDFGRSTPGEGTFKFKEQWGATPIPLFWHYWLKNGGALPELNPNNVKYRMAIEIWKQLPLPVTRLFGPSIVKNLP